MQRLNETHEGGLDATAALGADLCIDRNSQLGLRFALTLASMLGATWRRFIDQRAVSFRKKHVHRDPRALGTQTLRDG